MIGIVVVGGGGGGTCEASNGPGLFTLETVDNRCEGDPGTRDIDRLVDYRREKADYRLSTFEFDGRLLSLGADRGVQKGVHNTVRGTN